MPRFAALVLLLCSSVLSQPLFDPNIPTPEEVLGYELGDRFTPHVRIEQYVLLLKERAADRLRVISYGETYEGRKLYLVILSAPQNLARLEEIKAQNRRLSDPRTLTPKQAEEIIKTAPAIVWFSYGIHGNEASSPEAALHMIYQLAARRDQEVLSLLNNLLIIIDPLLNPDGHERYVNFQITRSGVKPVEDPNAAEHNEDWPSGRTNHYLIDLNRDWAWLTQKESQARVKVYQEWKPHVHVDFHEMNYASSYFFFPAFKPINQNLPKSTLEWAEIYGKANAAAFDSLGLSYYSEEFFDLFYPGFGDSWPSLNGAIGMTYEQAGTVGVRIKRSDESILTLKDRIKHHTVTAWATLKTTVAQREKRLRDFHEFFKVAIEEGKRGQVKAYIVPPAIDQARALKMLRLLKEQGVELLKAQKEFTVPDARTYFLTKPTVKKFPAGSYIIPLDQPSKRLIVALMEQEPVLADTFFYDISTWALPVAYGVETYWTGHPVTVPATKVDTLEEVRGAVVGGKAAYAYLLRWDSNDAVKSLVWLLQKDFKVNVAMKPFVLNGEKFDRGTIVIPVAANKPELHDRMQELARDLRVRIYAAHTGFTERGIDLGSDRVIRLKKPKIAVLTGSPVRAESFGFIWSLFDQHYGVDFVPIKLAQLRSADLRAYTALVFPDDYPSGEAYKSQIDSTLVQKIKEWINSGGTFVGIEGGAAFASATIGKIATVNIKEKKKEERKDSRKDTVETEKEKPSEDELEKRMTVEQRERKRRLESIPGTMVRVRLDTSHPLGFGYDTTIVVLKRTKRMFELSEKGYNVGIYTKAPRLSGYMSKDNEKMLEQTPYLVHEQLGSGNIVLFADDPNFRLFWDSLNKLFLNSLLLTPSIRKVTLTAD